MAIVQEGHEGRTEKKYEKVVACKSDGSIWGYYEILLYDYYEILGREKTVLICTDHKIAVRW